MAASTTMTEPTPVRTRSWWGWGWNEVALTDDECRRYGAALGAEAADPLPVPRVDDLDDRASHALGRAYRDVIRALHRTVDHPPDLVAHPASEADVVAVLDWAA